MGVNSITLVGRAGRDPEVRYFESGSVVANLTLAVNRRSRDDEPDWFNLEIWGKQAQVAADYQGGGHTGCHANCQTGCGAWNTRPPCTVPQTRTSLSCSGGTAVGSSSSTQKSARLPDSIEPISWSSLRV